MRPLAKRYVLTMWLSAMAKDHTDYAEPGHENHKAQRSCPDFHCMRTTAARYFGNSLALQDMTKTTWTGRKGHASTEGG